MSNYLLRKFYLMMTKLIMKTMNGYFDNRIYYHTYHIHPARPLSYSFPPCQTNLGKSTPPLPFRVPSFYLIRLLSKNFLQPPRLYGETPVFFFFFFSSRGLYTNTYTNTDMAQKSIENQIFKLSCLYFA